MLDAPGSGKTSRAATAKPAVWLWLRESFARPHRHSILYASHAAYGAVDGSETSVLLEPRFTAYGLQRTPRIESDQSDFGACRARFCTSEPRAMDCGRSPPRDRRNAPISLQSRSLGPKVATSSNLGGTPLAAAKIPNDAAGESAARTDSSAGSPERPRIRQICKSLKRWGTRGAPYHPV
jgi:hypothetical protein